MRLAKQAGFAGAMRHKIEIQDRKMRPGSTDFEERFTTEATVQAQINTLKRGISVFDGTNTDRVASHEFVIRQRDGMTAAKWVLFDGRRFDVLKTEFVNERRRFLRMLCVERGDEAHNVNRR